MKIVTYTYRTAMGFAYGRPDGRLCFIAPKYYDETRRRDLTDDEFCLFAVQEFFGKRGLSVPADCVVIDEADLPQGRTNRYFRNAWKGGAQGVYVDRAEAEAWHMNAIRKVRNEELERESGSKYRQPPEIEALFTPERRAKLQSLRDIPQTFDLGAYPTLDELKAAWPAELPKDAP